MAQQSASSRLANLPAAGLPRQNPSFTQRIKAAFTPGLPSHSGVSSSAAATAAQQKLDPISLGFASGPPTAQLYLSMAQLSDRGGNTDHARSMYQKALAMEPDNLDALLGWARLEDRQGHLNEARKIYQQAVAKHPRNAAALNDLALCYARQGQLRESLRALEQATQLRPDKPLYRNNIAKVLTELNRLDQAVAHLYAVYPPAVAQYNMGVLLQQRGRSSEAVRFLTAATRADPQLEPAQTLLTQITTGAPPREQRGIPSNQAPRQPIPPTLANQKQSMPDASISPQVSAAAVSTSNDDILPTPRISPDQSAGQPYPTTGAMSAIHAAQAVPTETAQAPVGNAPILLPPVR